MLKDGWYQSGEEHNRHLFFYVENNIKMWQFNLGADPDKPSGANYIYPLLDFVPDKSKAVNGLIPIQLLIYANGPEGNKTRTSLYRSDFTITGVSSLIPWSIDKHYDSLEKKLGIKRTVLSKDQQSESLSFLEIF